jgi:UDP-N-acetylmuramoyl-L-alanyl-D-glutamate--2,6-diaminopimelate ligase
MVMLGQLLADLGATVTGADVEVRALIHDSRRVTAGACFAALPGARADGHAFVAQALERGATSVICERAVDTGAATRAVVPDARLALATAARRFYGDPSRELVMVGLTGTNGKTTTTHIVQAMLEAAGTHTAVIGTLGWRLGSEYVETGLTTPESADLVALVRSLASMGARGIAMEASSHALAQRRVAGLDFDVAVFTNLTHDHLDYHHTMDAYFEAKAILFRERLKAGGRGVVNYDDPWARRLLGQDSIAFSASGDVNAALRVSAQQLSGGGTELELATPRGPLRLRSPLVGSFNVENVLSAVGVGEVLGLDHAVIAQGVAAVAAVPGRLERVSSAGEPLVVVDYAHTPDALEKVLKVVRAITKGRVLCVFGCGGDRDPQKRAPMGAAAAKLSDWAVLTSDNPRSEAPEAIAQAVEKGLVAAGATPASSPAQRGYVVELDRARAIRLAIAAARPEDAVVLAGKGHETYQLVGAEKRHFDDREEARAALREAHGLGGAR